MKLRPVDHQRIHSASHNVPDAAYYGDEISEADHPVVRFPKPWVIRVVLRFRYSVRHPEQREAQVNSAAFLPATGVAGFQNDDQCAFRRAG